MLDVLLAPFLDRDIARVPPHAGMRQVHRLHAGKDALDLAVQAALFWNTLQVEVAGSNG